MKGFSLKSDGTLTGTKVYYDDKMLQGVISAKFEMDAKTASGRLTLQVHPSFIDVIDLPPDVVIVKEDSNK